MDFKKNPDISLNVNGDDIMAEDKNIGTRMDWKDIAKTYPDCYVGLSDWINTGKTIIGILKYVCRNDEERLNNMRTSTENGEGLFWAYTTLPAGGTGLWQL